MGAFSLGSVVGPFLDWLQNSVALSAADLDRHRKETAAFAVVNLYGKQDGQHLCLSRQKRLSIPGVPILCIVCKFPGYP